MRLPVETRVALAALLCSGVALGGAPGFARNVPPAPAVPEGAGAQAGASGPAADYPVLVGEPYRVGNTVFTPVNTMNYDTVGYASVGAQGGGISAAHHTLPLPSYVEVTSLASGRTILVRLERRGPMDGTHTIELSPAAAQQLGVSGDAPVRVRRVNPLESERALLRLGQPAPERIPTPKPLLTVLERRLASDPAAAHAGASLARGPLVGVVEDQDAPVKAPTKAPAKPAPKDKAKSAEAKPTAGADFSASIPAPPPPAPSPKLTPKPAPAPNPLTEVKQPAPIALPHTTGAFTVQIGAFADKPRATALAQHLQGHLTPAGKLWRLRTGPYATQAQAEAALAKAKAAGYTDARIQRAD